MHVPYKGSVSALTDVVASVIPLMFVPCAVSEPIVPEACARLQFLKDTCAELPDVPPIADDVPGFEAVAWQML